MRRKWIKRHRFYSIRRQCKLAGLTRSSIYYKPTPESEENLKLMRLIDEQYLRHPEYGSPRMTDWLHEQGFVVNHKRVARLEHFTIVMPYYNAYTYLHEHSYSRYSSAGD